MILACHKCRCSRLGADAGAGHLQSRKRGFGIRLENDVLITETGNEDLMADIPIEPEEIEELMSWKAVRAMKAARNAKA